MITKKDLFTQVLGWAGLTVYTDQDQRSHKSWSDQGQRCVCACGFSFYMSRFIKIYTVWKNMFPTAGFISVTTDVRL